MDGSNLKPGLLLAMPKSSDRNLSGAVLLLIEHGARRSFGLVINRPSAMKVTELLDSLGMTWHGNPADVLWWGGPVESERGWVLHETVAVAQAGTIAITPAIAMSTTPERLRALTSEPGRRIRIVLGSIDWTVGQLARAMSRGGVCTEASPELMFDTAPDLLWERVQSIGEALPVDDGGIRGTIRRLFGQRRAIPTAIARRK